jgi:hypothetical protein
VLLVPKFDVDEYLRKYEQGEREYCRTVSLKKINPKRIFVKTFVLKIRNTSLIKTKEVCYCSKAH